MFQQTKSGRYISTNPHCLPTRPMTSSLIIQPILWQLPVKETCTISWRIVLSASLEHWRKRIGIVLKLNCILHNTLADFVLGSQFISPFIFTKCLIASFSGVGWVRVSMAIMMLTRAILCFRVSMAIMMLTRAILCYISIKSSTRAHIWSCKKGVSGIKHFNLALNEIFYYIYWYVLLPRPLEKLVIVGTFIIQDWLLL